MIPRLRYYFARGDWKFAAAALSLALFFGVFVRFVHI